MDSDPAELIGRLYQRHAGAVHRYALRRSDQETAEEVTAQVFLVAWRRRSSLPEDALPWLYGVARRALADQRRGATRRQRLEERLRGASDADTVALDLDDQGLAEGLQRLSAVDREALLLRYWEELEPAQVAQALGCSRAAAAVRLHRARRRLARELSVDAARTENNEHERSCGARTEEPA